MEEVFMPGQPEAILLPRDEPALHLLQRVRDEAHRFAVTYHRQIRGKRMVDSVLDEVDGIGPTRKKLLLKSFGSLKKIREAELDDLAEIVPEGVARSLYAALHGG
jgi:excinuclease ABC subunit C